MSNVVTLAVYADNKNGIPTTEESHAKKKAYTAFRLRHKRCAALSVFKWFETNGLVS